MLNLNGKITFITQRYRSKNVSRLYCNYFSFDHLYILKTKASWINPFDCSHFLIFQYISIYVIALLRDFLLILYQLYVHLIIIPTVLLFHIHITIHLVSIILMKDFIIPVGYISHNFIQISSNQWNFVIKLSYFAFALFFNYFYTFVQLLQSLYVHLQFTLHYAQISSF